MKAGSLVPQIASALTERRLRIHGLILAICVWSLYAMDVGRPGIRDRQGLIKGTDFVHFYTLGSLSLQGRGLELYNSGAQAALAAQLVPGVPVLHYVALYGPQVSLFFAPFAKMSYGWALGWWWLLSTAIYALGCYAIWRVCPRLRVYGPTVVILTIAYPAFFHLIAWGQTSAPALLCFTMAFLALRAKRDFLAGLAVGLLAFKPPLGLAAAVIFLAAQEWRVVAGAVVSMTTQLSVAWAHYGSEVMRIYFRALGQLNALFPYLEPRPYQAHSLRAFWSNLVPQPRVAMALYAGTTVAVLILAVLVWQSGAPLSLRFSALLFATVLAAPHLTVYDLLILAPAFLLLSDWAIEHLESPHVPAIAVLLYLAYALPLIGPAVQYTHLQLSVLAFATLLYLIWRIASNYEWEARAA